MRQNGKVGQFAGGGKRQGMKKLGMIVNAHKPGAVAMARRLLQWGRDRGLSFLLPHLEASVLTAAGLSDEEFLRKLSEDFIVEKKGTEIFKPSRLHEFSLYLGGNWYSLVAKPGTYNDNDPIGVLDVTISSNLILDKILGIKDLRSDKRIDFVGGIRGLGELKKRVDSGEMKVALALYPVSMKQLIDIADTGNIMPPKTTWFEPKLRSGLVIHKLS